MTTKLLKIFALAAAFTASAASAAPVYLTLDTGVSHQTHAPADVDFKNRQSMGATLGIQATPDLAAEIAYKNLGQRTILGTDYSARVLSASVVGSVPLTPKTSAFAKLGIAQSQTTTRVNSSTHAESNTHLVAGVGIECPLPLKNTSVQTAYEIYPHFGHTGKSIQHLSVGAKYTF